MRKSVLAILGVLALTSRVAAAQSTTPGAPLVVLSEAKQIAAATLPLPEEFRDSATVLGYRASGALETLREGKGAFTCLASDPKLERFHVACYHRSLEPFMARGRQLRVEGVRGDQIDSVRFAEVRSGRLSFPTAPAMLYSITGDAGSYDSATGTIKGRALFVVYVKDATAATTGLPAQPSPGTPWIMHPGTIKAHIMFVPTM